LRITFKYVGQGDCILIEWEQDGQRKIGIVDCNAHGPSNVVIRHLQTTGYGEIDFIILSHPHRDHYSGFTALLQYCKDSNVRILRFIHTCKNVHAFLSSFFIPIEDRSTLDQVFVSTHALRKIGLLQARFEVNQHFVAELGNGLRMRFLAPSIFFPP
jgi:metal-dependent hydrolase (beta-lactamase superfamily II)